MRRVVGWVSADGAAGGEMASVRTWTKTLIGLGILAGSQGCSDSTDGTLYGTSVADSFGADLGVGQDAPKADGDAGGATDTAGDSAPEVAPEIVQDIQSDSAMADIAVDTAQPDTAKPDTASPDTASPDTAADVPADPCAAKLAQFAGLKSKALMCATPFDCYQPAVADGKCQSCQRHYNGKLADTQNLIDMGASLIGSGCGSMCGSGCANMATQVGVCSAGQCATKELSCKELDIAASAALAEGAKCKADSDCVFKVSNTLGCGCPTFVNVTSMGPGKPLFSYMKMLVLAYKAKVCVPETSCACPDPNTAKCVAGVCIAQ